MLLVLLLLAIYGIDLSDCLFWCPTEIALIDRLDHVKGGGHGTIPTAISAINLRYRVIFCLNLAKKVLAHALW